MHWKMVFLIASGRTGFLIYRRLILKLCLLPNTNHWKWIKSLHFMKWESEIIRLKHRENLQTLQWTETIEAWETKAELAKPWLPQSKKILQRKEPVNKAQRQNTKGEKIFSKCICGKRLVWVHETNVIIKQRFLKVANRYI